MPFPHPRCGVDIPTKSHPVLRPLRLSEAPFSILEHAHWVPYSAGLSEKFRPKAADAAQDEKMFVNLRRLWSRQEIWLSHALECVLLGYGPSLLSEVFGGEAGWSERCALYSADWPGISRDVGVPDLIAIRGTTLYLVEIKSGATASKHRYSRQQHEKYMKFAALAICVDTLAIEEDAPLKVSGVEHWLIAKSAQIEECVSDLRDWRPAIGRDGRLTIGNDDARSAIEGEVEAFLGSKAKKLALTPGRFNGLAQVPTRLLAWPDFAGNLRRIAENGKRSDLALEADRLEALALGHAAIRTKA